MPEVHNVEQHAPLTAHESPSTLHAPPPGMGAQVLALHTPVQHWSGLWQAWPVATQAAVPHWPETQLALQQSVSTVHAAPGSRQKVDEVQTVPLQLPAQHGSVVLQGPPAATHLPASGSTPPPPPVPTPPPVAVPPPLSPPPPVPESPVTLVLGH